MCSRVCVFNCPQPGTGHAVSLVRNSRDCWDRTRCNHASTCPWFNVRSGFSLRELRYFTYFHITSVYATITVSSFISTHSWTLHFDFYVTHTHTASLPVVLFLILVLFVFPERQNPIHLETFMGGSRNSALASETFINSFTCHVLASPSSVREFLQLPNLFNLEHFSLDFSPIVCTLTKRTIFHQH